MRTRGWIFYQKFGKQKNLLRSKIYCMGLPRKIRDTVRLNNRPERMLTYLLCQPLLLVNSEHWIQLTAQLHFCMAKVRMLCIYCTTTRDEYKEQILKSWKCNYKLNETAKIRYFEIWDEFEKLCCQWSNLYIIITIN